MSNGDDNTKSNVLAMPVRKKPPIATGHEIPLASMIKNGYTIGIMLLSGESARGVVTSFDKWTITIQIAGRPYPTTFFKHAIESFTRIDV